MASKSSRANSSKSVLRGLNPNNIIKPSGTQPTIEIDGDKKATRGHGYVTRAAQNGRDNDTYEKYDMKHHPADWNLRPTQAAKRHSVGKAGSCSPSASTMANEEDDHSSETDEQSLPTSEEDSDNEAEIVASKSKSGRGASHNSRKPDPKTSRTSKRPQAQLLIDYSTKHHKDDEHIPGFQRRGRQHKRSATDNSDEGNIKKERKTVKGRANQAQVALPDSQQSEDADELVEEALLALSASVSTKPSAQVLADPSDEEGSDAGDSPESFEPADDELQDDPLPEFTTLQDEPQDYPDEDHPQSEHPMPSHDIDEELLSFTQVPPSDGARAADVAALEKVTSEAHNLPSASIESSEKALDGLENESSSALQESSASREIVQETATSPPSEGAQPTIGQRKSNESPKNNEISSPAPVLYQTAQATVQGVMSLLKFGNNTSSSLEDPEANAENGHGDQSNAPLTKFSAKDNELLADVDETHESSTTLEGDVSMTGSVTMEVRGSNQQVPGTEQASAPGHEGHNDGEPVEAGTTTLTAMLEQDIASSQGTVANHHLPEYRF